MNEAPSAKRTKLEGPGHMKIRRTSAASVVANAKADVLMADVLMAEVCKGPALVDTDTNLRAACQEAGIKALAARVAKSRMQGSAGAPVRRHHYERQGAAIRELGRLEAFAAYAQIR